MANFKNRNIIETYNLQDLEYWGVDELYLEPCCVQRYYQQKELLNWEHQAKKEEEVEIFSTSRLGRLQKVLWDLFEKPHTSIGARVSQFSIGLNIGTAILRYGSL